VPQEGLSAVPMLKIGFFSPSTVFNHTCGISCESRTRVASAAALTLFAELTLRFFIAANPNYASRDAESRVLTLADLLFFRRNSIGPFGRLGRLRRSSATRAGDLERSVELLTPCSTLQYNQIDLNLVGQHSRHPAKLQKAVSSQSRGVRTEAEARLD
jgi:hypothetical protein